MSGITNRTIFVTKGIDKFYRISDWSVVVTDIGSMFEPMSINKLCLNDADGFNASDMMARIDHVRNHDPGALILGDETVTGGWLNPVFQY